MTKLVSSFVLKKREKTAKKALKLYNEGHTLRQIGALLGMSHEWVRRIINELEATVHKSPIDKNDA